MQKVLERTIKDIIKIGKLADNVKRDRRVAKTLKNLDAGMLDVTAPVLNLPKSNVFRETVIRCSLPIFDEMKRILSRKVKEAQKSADRKSETKTGRSCVFA